MEVAMAAWKLSSQEWDALDELRFSTTDARLFRSATIILMTAVGRSKHSIAHDLGCSPATVDNVRQRYRHQGLAGLRPSKPTGRPAEVTAE
jgi:transposase